MEDSEEPLAQTAENDRPDTVSKYHMTLVPIEDLKLISHPRKPTGAQAPRYDRERDEPAFDAAWKEVAELRAQGKIKPIPPIPPGGLRVPRPRLRTTE